MCHHFLVIFICYPDCNGLKIYLGYQFEAVAFGSTAMCGRSTFWFWVISAVPFYCATWEHYFTNTLILPAINGPTEGLLLIYVMHFFTAIVGAEWWAQQFGKSIPIFSWVPFISEIPTSSAVLFLMIVFAVIPTLSFNTYNVYNVVQARKGSMLLALAMLYPFAVLLSGILAWDYLSPIDLIGTYPPLVVVGTGFAFGFLVGRMILAHLCDEPKGLKTSMCMSLLYLPFALANALTARLNDGCGISPFSVFMDNTKRSLSVIGFVFSCELIFYLLCWKADISGILKSLLFLRLNFVAGLCTQWSSTTTTTTTTAAATRGS
ncbi:hypothetical protein M9H77_13874 [Catharanthus roseus]|uniref:Uncharacterized protein n=1 Tax=Catharanthus roseus TaxID=4058 RepID=A0ACC0BLH6_CATRO|nr:hypothetical protein M9H77_13874 [Catharanthus roseus]